MTMPRIAVLAALRDELAAASAALPANAAAQVSFHSCGVGPVRAAQTAAKLLAGPLPPRIVCSTGFCGGLHPELAVGDIVLAQAVSCEPALSAALQIDSRFTAPLEAALASKNIRHRRGLLVSTSSAVTGTAQKAQLGARLGAVAVDMESFSMASQVTAAGAAFLAVRAVSDDASDALPAEIGTFLDAEGRPRIGNVLLFALKSPRNAGMIWGMKRRSDQARSALNRAWAAVWPELAKAEV